MTHFPFPYIESVSSTPDSLCQSWFVSIDDSGRLFIPFKESTLPDDSDYLLCSIQGLEQNDSFTLNPTGWFGIYHPVHLGVEII